MKREKFMVISHYPTYANASFYDFTPKGLSLALVDYNNEQTGTDVESVYLFALDKTAKTIQLKRWEVEK